MIQLINVTDVENTKDEAKKARNELKKILGITNPANVAPGKKKAVIVTLLTNKVSTNNTAALTSNGKSPKLIILTGNPIILIIGESKTERIA